MGRDRDKADISPAPPRWAAGNAPLSTTAAHHLPPIRPRLFSIGFGEGLSSNPLWRRVVFKPSLAKGCLQTLFGEGLSSNPLWRRVVFKPSLTKGCLQTLFDEGLSSNPLWQRVVFKPSLTKGCLHLTL